MRKARAETGSPSTTEGRARPTDAEIVRRCRWDLEAFVDLYDRYVDEVFRYCNRRLPRAAAQDATSVAFLNAIAAVRSLDPDRIDSFRPWLFTIVRNAVVDQLRTQQHLPLDQLDLTVRGPSLDDRAILADRRRQVSRAISALGSEQQQVLELRLAGLQNAEIGKVLGKSPGAIRVIHHRAVARLRQLLGERETSAPNGKEPT